MRRDGAAGDEQPARLLRGFPVSWRAGFPPPALAAEREPASDVSEGERGGHDRFPAPLPGQSSEGHLHNLPPPPLRPSDCSIESAKREGGQEGLSSRA